MDENDRLDFCLIDYYKRAYYSGYTAAAAQVQSEVERIGRILDLPPSTVGWVKKMLADVMLIKNGL